MTGPTVSVLMPAYDVERYIGKSIVSVLSQSYQDLELIAVDDGSTDATLSIIRRFEKQDARVRVVALRKSGIPAVRNAGLNAARGSLVACLDSDDIAERMRIERQVGYMNDHPDCVVLGSQATLIDEDDDVIGASDQPLTHAAIEAELWKGYGSAILQPTAMMRRDAVLQVGGYREDLQVSEDLDLYLKLGEVGELTNLSERLVRFRRHCRSVSAVGNEIERANPRVDILKQALVRRGLPPREFTLSIPSHPSTVAEWHARWAFRAHANGYHRSARKQAWRAFCTGPLNTWSWRAVVHILLGDRVGGCFRRVLRRA